MPSPNVRVVCVCVCVCVCAKNLLYKKQVVILSILPNMLEKSRNRQPLVENDNSTSGSSVITKPTATITNISIVKTAVASEYGIHNHTGRFYNQPCFYIRISIEAHMRAWNSAPLLPFDRCSSSHFLLSTFYFGENIFCISYTPVSNL